MELLTVLLVVAAGVVLSVASNWLYDILKARGTLRDRPSVKLLVVAFAFLVPAVGVISVDTLRSDKRNPKAMTEETCLAGLEKLRPIERRFVRIWLCETRFANIWAQPPSMSVDAESLLVQNFPAVDPRVALAHRPGPVTQEPNHSGADFSLRRI
jgi:hypothetical protein